MSQFPTPPEFSLPWHTLDIKGLSYAYIDQPSQAGSATGPVVFLHGNPTWSYLFRHLLTATNAQGYRVLAPDHMGMGRSQRPTKADYPFTLERRIEDFTAFMDHVVPEGPVSLVLHDWGGAIGMGWAVENPERICRLVLMNTAAFPAPTEKKVPGILRLARSWLIGRPAVIYGNAFVRGTLHVGCTSRLPRPVRHGYLTPYATPAQREAIFRFVRDIPTSPHSPTAHRLRRIEDRLSRLADVPTLVAWGMKDFVFDAQVLHRWQQLLPDAQVVRFPTAGHLLPEEARQPLAELIPAFLRAPHGTMEAATDDREDAVFLANP